MYRKSGRSTCSKRRSSENGGCSFRTVLPLILSFNLFRAYSRYPAYLIFPNVLFKIPSYLFLAFHVQAARMFTFSLLNKSSVFPFEHFYLANVYKAVFMRATDFMMKSEVTMKQSVSVIVTFQYYFHNCCNCANKMLGISSYYVDYIQRHTAVRNHGSPHLRQTEIQADV